jgi:2,3-bisphosphoglycerate-dependent phosphoglycerate mutase
VILVRHAEPLLPEPDGLGDFERGLTDQGHRQAERLVAELVAFQPVAVVSSPYLRAVQTVEPTARYLGMSVLRRTALREWDSGLEPRPDFAEHYARSWAEPGMSRPGGESLAQLSKRAVEALWALTGEFAGCAVVPGTRRAMPSSRSPGAGRVVADRTSSRVQPQEVLPAQRLGAVLPNAAWLLLQKKYLRLLASVDQPRCNISGDRASVLSQNVLPPRRR